MSAAGIWAASLVSSGCALAAGLVTGPSRLTVALALVSVLVVLLALVIDGPPPERSDRRPW